MQTPDHHHGQLALAVEHFVHPIHLSNHGLQIFGFEALRLHAEKNGLYRARRAQGVVLGFIGLDQWDHLLKVSAVPVAALICR